MVCGAPRGAACLACARCRRQRVTAKCPEPSTRHFPKQGTLGGMRERKGKARELQQEEETGEKKHREKGKKKKDGTEEEGGGEEKRDLGSQWGHVEKAVGVFVGKLVNRQNCVCARETAPTEGTEVSSCSQDKSSESSWHWDETTPGGDCPGPRLRAWSAAACAARSCSPGPSQLPALSPVQPRPPHPCVLPADHLLARSEPGRRGVGRGVGRR